MSVGDPQTTTEQFNRLYFLPINRTCNETCHYCQALGCLSQEKKQPTTLQKSLLKANSGDYTGILLPCNFLYQSDYHEKICQILAAGLRPIIQLNSRYLNSRWWPLLQRLNSSGCHFNLLIGDNRNTELPKLTRWLENLNPATFYTLIGTRHHNLEATILDFSIEQYHKLDFYFPYWSEIFPEGYSPNEIYQITQKLKNKHPLLELRSPRGIDIYDSRIAADMDLEPLLPPESLGLPQSQENEISVIIPVYNNLNYLKNTIKHLAKQSLDSNMYEVIVIDDGSTDGTKEKFRLWAREMALPIQLLFIHFARRRPRKMGDSQFRAGVARNLGVKYARGRILAFLDSDILTPYNYLQTLLSEHQKHPVIQVRRLFLKKSVSHVDTDYSAIIPEAHTYIPEGGYWHKFYQVGETWNKLENPWKYVCTYALSLPKDLFKSIGWFRKNYIFYGFEDTDLGLRLTQRQIPFHLSSLIVYHLDHSSERSEFFNSDYLRQKLLKNTARIFFHNNLDSDSFIALKGLMQNDFNVKQILSKLWDRTIGTKPFDNNL